MTARVERRMVTRYFATRVLPNGDDTSRVQRRSFAREATAWVWVARAALFSARDQRCGSGYGGLDEYSNACMCKLCDPAKWQPVERLARILRARARRNEG